MCSWQQSNTAALLHVVFVLDESSSAKVAGHDLHCMRLASSHVKARNGQMSKWKLGGGKAGVFC
jgi:hypothetical protein